MNQAAPIPAFLPADLRQTADYILRMQLADGAIPWYAAGKLDPWDHTEAAMALSIAGHWQAAERAYNWLAQQQLADGSWYANYFMKEAEFSGKDGCFIGGHSDLRETNFIAYVATGVWHHFLITRNRQFLQQMFPCVANAVGFVLRYQSEHGEIAWAVDVNGRAQDDALVTACCSILRSLDCACRMAETLSQDRRDWREAADRLHHTLCCRPDRFDRTWESKARFSMDWYYPILAGLYPREVAQTRLQRRWQEFVEPGLGCRCVNDEPWVTMAETSELVIALVAADLRDEARTLFDTLAQWRDGDGGYWTGFVFRDNTIWPAEKTTWTAGAVLIAADTLYGYTPAHSLFLQQRETRIELA